MTNEKKQITFIINPISGTQKKDEIPPLIEELLDKSQFDVDLRITEYAGHAAELARQCAADGVDIVVAVGGDGTVNEVARSLRATDWHATCAFLLTRARLSHSSTSAASRPSTMASSTDCPSSVRAAWGLMRSSR